MAAAAWAPTRQEDTNQQRLWTGFEGFLQEQFPDAMQVVTTHVDPLYETEDSQAFLRGLGYRPVSYRAFGKELTPL